MSPEYLALLKLRRPENPRTGDMYLCRRLGAVRVVSGHKRGQSSRKGLGSFHLYHWHKPSLIARPCDWRDCDPNAGRAFAPGNDGEAWEYLGNIFDMLPYEALTRTGATP